MVDLGLVYDMSIEEGNVAVLQMTLTSAACRLQDVIEDLGRHGGQDDQLLLRLPDVFDLVSDGGHG